MAAPTLVGQALATTPGATFVTSSLSPASGTLLLWVLTGGANPVVAVQPSTVTGLGLTWTHVDGATYSTGRVRADLYTARGTPTPGTITISYASSMSRIIWSVHHTDDVIAQAASSSALTTTTTVTLPTAPAGEVVSGVVPNTTNYTPAGNQGQVAYGTVLGSPSGPVFALHAFHQTPGTQTQSYTLGVSTYQALISVDLIAAPPSGPQTYLTVDGVEIPVTVSLMVDGVETPASLDL